MDFTTIALISASMASNLICFLFGMLYGRNSAYKTVRTFQTADTHVDMSSATQSKSGNFS